MALLDEERVAAMAETMPSWLILAASPLPAPPAVVALVVALPEL